MALILFVVRPPVAEKKKRVVTVSGCSSHPKNPRGPFFLPLFLLAGKKPTKKRGKGEAAHPNLQLLDRKRKKPWCCLGRGGKRRKKGGGGRSPFFPRKNRRRRLPFLAGNVKRRGISFLFPFQEGRGGNGGKGGKDSPNF